MGARCCAAATLGLRSESLFLRFAMASTDFYIIIEKLAGSLVDNPPLAAWTIIGSVFVWRLPALVRASAEALRKGKLNKVEVARQQALLRDDLEKRLERRRRPERRNDL